MSLMLIEQQDMGDVRAELQRMKQENHDLEKELRSNVNAEQKARLLEAKVTENLENINHKKHSEFIAGSGRGTDEPRTYRPPRRYLPTQCARCWRGVGAPPSHRMTSRRRPSRCLEVVSNTGMPPMWDGAPRSMDTDIRCALSASQLLKLALV